MNSTLPNDGSCIPRISKQKIELSKVSVHQTTFLNQDCRQSECFHTFACFLNWSHSVVFLCAISLGCRVCLQCQRNRLSGNNRTQVHRTEVQLCLLTHSAPEMRTTKDRQTDIDLYSWKDKESLVVWWYLKRCGQRLAGLQPILICVIYRRPVGVRCRSLWQVGDVIMLYTAAPGNVNCIHLLYSPTACHRHCLYCHGAGEALSTATEYRWKYGRPILTVYRTRYPKFTHRRIRLLIYLCLLFESQHLILQNDL